MSTRRCKSIPRKRRFSKDERNVRRVCSNHFSMSSRPNKVLTPAEKCIEKTHRAFRSGIEKLRLGALKTEVGLFFFLQCPFLSGKNVTKTDGSMCQNRTFAFQDFLSVYASQTKSFENRNKRFCVYFIRVTLPKSSTQVSVSGSLILRNFIHPKRRFWNDEQKIGRTYMFKVEDFATSKYFR